MLSGPSSREIVRETGGYLSQSDPIWEALATVWKLKKEYRAELVARRRVESAELRAKFAKVQVAI